jgi:hypothetical protein
MAGIAFQVATMATCMVLTLDFFIRLRRNTRNNVASTGTPGALSDPKFKFYLACSAFGFLTIFIRCVYRYVWINATFDVHLLTLFNSLPEMAGGWGGELMRREAEFMVLDGM